MQSKAESSERGCLHTVLLPHWDRIEDMGHADRATSFRCQSCNEQFTPEQAQRLQQTEAERLRASSELPR